MHRLSKEEFAIFVHLIHDERTISELAEQIGRSRKRASALVLGLDRKGFVHRDRVGMVYRVSISSRTHAVMLKELMLRGLPVEKYLVDSRMDVAATLAMSRLPLRTRDIVEITSMSPSTVRYSLKDLVRYGVVSRIGTRYHVSRSMDRLRQFLVEHSIQHNQRVISELVDDGIIVWQLGFSFIFTSKHPVEMPNVHPTGVTAFTENGVELIGERFTYRCYSSPRALGLEDWVIDNILAHPHSTTHMIYSLVFLKKNIDDVTPERLIELSRIYSLEDLGERMVGYVNGVDDPGLPPRNEFDEKYVMYGGQHG